MHLWSDIAHVCLNKHNNNEAEDGLENPRILGIFKPFWERKSLHVPGDERREKLITFWAYVEL